MNAQATSLSNGIKRIALMPGNKISLFIDESSSFHFIDSCLIASNQCLPISIQCLILFHHLLFPCQYRTILSQPVSQKSPIVHWAKTNAYTVLFSCHLPEPMFRSPGTGFHFRNIPHRQQHPAKNILFQSP